MSTAALLSVMCGAAGAADTVAEDEAAITKYIQALHDPSNEVRTAAAKALREIVAKYPSGTTNIRERDGGEARWKARLNEVKIGMTREEVGQILPQIVSSHYDSLFMSGGGSSFVWRLDPHWVAGVYFRRPHKGESPALRVHVLPKLIRSELLVRAGQPDEKSGTWLEWYVNGQKGREIHLKNGKMDGPCIEYFDNGQKRSEGLWKEGALVEGSERKWNREGVQTE